MMLPTEGSFSEVICEMDAVRKIYEDVPDTIPVPPELRHRKVEVIILPLDDDGSKTSVTVVEFFVTSKALNRYFELEWNPLGGVFDAIIENKMDEKGVSKSFRGDWGYTAKTMKSAATFHEVFAGHKPLH